MTIIVQKPKQPNVSVVGDEIANTKNFIHVTNIGWYWWDADSGVWQLDEKGILRQHVYKRLKGFSKKTICNDVLDYAESFVSVTPAEIDENRDLINFRNGMYSLSKRKLYKHARVNLSTMQLPYEYDLKAKCSIFTRYIAEVLPIDDVVIAQEVAGNIFARDNRSKIWWLIGTGRNGKGVFTTTLKNLVGKGNYCSISMSDIGNNFYAAALRGKWLNTAGEAEYSVKTVARLKEITGGDELTVSEKFKKPFTFDPSTVNLVFSMNDVPRLRDSSRAITERIEILWFRRKFYGKDDDKGLRCKIAAELPGVFNWAMEGYQRVEENFGHFSPSGSSGEAKAILLLSVNPLKLFASDTLVERMGRKVKVEDLKRIYTIWCTKKRVKPDHLAQLAFHLEEILLPPEWCIRVKKSNNTYYIENVELKLKWQIEEMENDE